MRRICSSTVGPPASSRCIRTWTGRRTSGSSWTTTRPPTYTNGTGAICISRPKNWSRWKVPNRERKPAVEIVGVIATTFVVVLVAMGLYLGLRSVPDLRRYLRIRRM
ncbi:DUF6893 family small protein [Nocardia sp. 004]|uniref:DUF6893 family small protein n=1 Tax=Nocardia sp. 004 TaxID=3385978 RepID=UPI0039A23369